MISEYYLYIGILLFSIGLTIVIIKRNLIMILMGIELMLNSATLNFVACGTEGSITALFIIVIAVAEASIGLALILAFVRYYKTSNLDEINQLKG